MKQLFFIGVIIAIALFIAAINGKDGLFRKTIDPYTAIPDSTVQMPKSNKVGKNESYFDDSAWNDYMYNEYRKDFERIVRVAVMAEVVQPDSTEIEIAKTEYQSDKGKYFASGFGVSKRYGVKKHFVFTVTADIDFGASKWVIDPVEGVIIKTLD